MNQRILNLRRKILSWYRKNKRDLPWRRTKNPYHILVSEIMLQQTQVLRVLPKYAEFIKAYPTVDALANSSLADVLKIWSGLGYNRRAKYLKEMAKIVKDCYDGNIPNTYEGLRTLPGIGDYTANAVLCFAFKQKQLAVDTNVRNVVERELRNNTPLTLDEIKKSMDQLMPNDHPDQFLHALMDYSSLALTRPMRNRKILKPFKLSNRYIRGKLINKLTKKSYRVQKLIKEIKNETHRSIQDIHTAFEELKQESLIVEKEGIVTLPMLV